MSNDPWPDSLHPAAPGFSESEKKRRGERCDKLFRALGKGVALICSADEVIRSGDSCYPFRQDSSFQYLTGFPEPDAALLLVGGDTPRRILFCRDKNPERELWDGFRFGSTLAKAVFGVDEAYAIDELPTVLAACLDRCPVCYYALGDAHADKLVMSAILTLRGQARQGKQPPATLADLRLLVDALRQIKDDDELAHMRRAADISSRAHEQAMRGCRPDCYEFEIEAMLGGAFRAAGAAAHAYTPIVATGANACVLHYVRNSDRLRAGDLLLVDAGCEYAGYAADITRTYPVSGRFTPEQRDCYQAVLAAEEAAINAVKPGVAFDVPHQVAVAVLSQALLDIGLLKANDVGTAHDVVASKAYERFFMHRTSHWLGLDVHDVGPYKNVAGEWVPLVSGMVLTIEPGLYIRPAEDIDAAFHHIGIRIEDDVRVTDSGVDVLTTAAKSVAAIEALVGSG